MPLTWKLTGVIADQIYAHLDQEKFLPEEQKGCRKNYIATNDLIYIDRAVIKEVKSRNKNLAMPWRDHKKAYDIVPHSWVIECFDLLGVAENIKSLLVNSMALILIFFGGLLQYFDNLMLHLKHLQSR